MSEARTLRAEIGIYNPGSAPLVLLDSRIVRAISWATPRGSPPFLRTQIMDVTWDGPPASECDTLEAPTIRAHETLWFGIQVNTDDSSAGQRGVLVDVELHLGTTFCTAPKIVRKRLFLHVTSATTEHGEAKGGARPPPGDDGSVQVTIASARLGARGLVVDLRVYNRAEKTMRVLNGGIVRTLSIAGAGGEQELSHTEPRGYVAGNEELATACDALDGPLMRPHESASWTVQWPANLGELDRGRLGRVELEVELQVGPFDCVGPAIVHRHLSAPIEG